VVERAIAGMDDVRKIKSSLTAAKSNIDRAAGTVDLVTDRVREHLRQIDDLVLVADGEATAPAAPEAEQSELL
jgi:hypothetical protein